MNTKPRSRKVKALGLTSGGLDNPEDFKTIVEEFQRNGHDVEFQVNMEKEFVNEMQGDNLVNPPEKFTEGIGD